MTRELPIVVLNAAAATGSGDTFDLEGTANEFFAAVVVTGTPSALTTHVEGSLDGSNWYVLTAESSSTASFFTIGPYGSPSLRLARYIRGVIDTMTGGTSPTVTMTAAWAVF